MENNQEKEDSRSNSQKQLSFKQYLEKHSPNRKQNDYDNQLLETVNFTQAANTNFNQNKFETPAPAPKQKSAEVQSSEIIYESPDRKSKILLSKASPGALGQNSIVIKYNSNFSTPQRNEQNLSSQKKQNESSKKSYETLMKANQFLLDKNKTPDKYCSTLDLLQAEKK